MSTRSIIGIIEDDTLTTVYCHWNGYPRHNGGILLNHYTTEEKVRELISRGDISLLKPQIGVKMTREEHQIHLRDDNIPASEKQCLFYKRDVGESDERNEPKVGNVSTQMFDVNRFGMIEWVYLFSEGEWLFAPRAVGNGDHLINDRPLIKLNEQHVDNDSYFRVEKEKTNNGT